MCIRDRSTGAAVIFGVTGGVLEAALRTVYETLEGKTLEKMEFEEVRGFEGLKIATLEIAGITINAAIAHGLANARKVVEEVKNGNPRNLHVIEVMACPGGCIGGGGQPYHHGDGTILEKRTKATYHIDENMPIRKSHENPYIQQDVYKRQRVDLPQPLGPTIAINSPFSTVNDISERAFVSPFML